MIRPTRKGRIKVLVTHRPRYEDWSLPKGKADYDETPEETAVREVWEETGYRCRVVAPIGKTRYKVSGRNKEVAWFAMRPLPTSDSFTPNNEVDRIKWLTPKKAVAALDYARDRQLIAETDLKALSRTGTLFLVRHGNAGDRSRWHKSDITRPLTKTGIAQAKAIARRLEDRGIERILSSPYDRCIQSVLPLAERIGAEVEIVPELSEEPDTPSAWELVAGLTGTNAVLCSHGDVIAGLVGRLMTEGLSLGSRLYCSKGSTWEIEVDGGKFTTGTYVPPPES